jgi:multimeric flavodoxin WrbA
MIERSKNLVILGSAREDSNTLKAVVKTFPLNDFTIVDLLKFKIDHYQYSQVNTKDDFFSIVEKMVVADTITFATPVYWYSMSGRMKVFFDRFSDLLGKPAGRQLAGKTVNLVAVGSSPELPQGFEVPFLETSRYLKMNFHKTIYYQI